jgi:tRNA splicing ligase
MKNEYYTYPITVSIRLNRDVILIANILGNIIIISTKVGNKQTVTTSDCCSTVAQGSYTTLIEAMNL